MKRLIFSALVLSAVTANAQVKNGMVGINTDEPRATMHIEPGVSESKGLIIPRITAAQMKTMTNLAHFGADHHAIITYLKENLPLADRTGKLVDVADPGYYYYDNTTGVQKWKTFGGGEQDFKVIPASTPGFYNYLTKGGGVGNNGTSLGTGRGNIGIGGPSAFYFANNSDMTGNWNTGIGQGVFQFPNAGTMSSDSNVGVGFAVYSLYNGGSMTGGDNIGMGTGIYKLYKTNAQFSGHGNTGIGMDLFSLQNGDLAGGSNIGMGQTIFSLPNSGDLTGYSNIGIGGQIYKMQSGNIGANNNIGMGYGLYNLNKTTGAVFSGHSNTGIGQSIFSLTNGDLTGYNNIGMGYSLYSLTSGNMNGASNIGIGSNSYTIVNGDMATNANNNIALGNSIYRLSNSSTSTFSGANNIGIGNTLYNLPLGNLTGQRNIGMGNNVFSVAAGDLSGNDNIGIGTGAMQADAGIIGGNNIALGTNAMSTGTWNNKLVGTNNIAIGDHALYTLGGDILGSYNIGIGYRVLETYMGRGSHNIHIGNKTTPTVPYIPGQLNEVIAIGNRMHPLAPVTTDNNVILLGSNRADSPKIGMGIYKPQAKLDVNGGVRVANDTSACTSANGGTIRYDGTNFYGCTSSGWKQLNN